MVALRIIISVPCDSTLTEFVFVRLVLSGLFDLIFALVYTLPFLGALYIFNEKQNSETCNQDRKRSEIIPVGNQGPEL